MSSAARSSPASPLTVSCVVLTRGDRPAELSRALESLLRQDGPAVDIVVVANGAPLPPVPDGVRGMSLPYNVGIAAGRNTGAATCQSDVVMFLDDDGWLVAPDAVEALRADFATDPGLGIVSFRIVDPESGQSQRRHVPRLQAADPLRSSLVTTFLGGACAIRSTVLSECGGLPDAFFYAHEETDLAWRALDAGWSIRYDARVAMYHPATSPGRHVEYLRLNARNRVWLARRNLPAPLLVGYLTTWVVLTAARVRDPGALRTWAAGFVEGWRTDAGPRRPMSWRTAVRMTRLGRPPLV